MAPYCLDFLGDIELECRCSRVRRSNAASNTATAHGFPKALRIDADRYGYAARASLVSLHYRIGTQALRAKRCDRALYDFDLAHKKFSAIQKYVTGKDIRNLLDVATANALFCQGNTSDGDKLFGSVRKRAESKAAVGLLCALNSGGCK